MHKSLKIAELNDDFRKNFFRDKVNKIVMTEGISTLADQGMGYHILKKVRDFDTFDEGDDPYGEHDFGAFELDSGHRIFWKIDYYDKTMTMGSPDPTDPNVTIRVLTIMLAEEY